MARPRSDEKRGAIMAAATRVIAAEGLGAATAAIAQEAGVSNGSLFTYFETKADLLNHLYLELKAEMAVGRVGGSPARGERRPRADAACMVRLAALGDILPRKAPDARASWRIGRHHSGDPRGRPPAR